MMTSHSKTSKSPAKPKKKKSNAIPSNIRKRAMEALQKLRRAEEADDNGMVQCITCRRVMHWTEAQGGHYISRGCHATEIEEDNIWPQCPRCNGPMNGRPIDYRMNLVRKIGEDRVKRLENMKIANDILEKFKDPTDEDNEAIKALSPSDRASITQKKGKVYYKEKYDEYRRRLKELNVK